MRPLPCATWPAYLPVWLPTCPVGCRQLTSTVRARPPPVQDYAPHPLCMCACACRLSALQRGLPRGGAAAQHPAGQGCAPAPPAAARLLPGGGAVLRGGGARSAGSSRHAGSGPLCNPSPSLSPACAMPHMSNCTGMCGPCLLVCAQARGACSAAWQSTWASRASGTVAVLPALYLLSMFRDRVQF